MKKGEIWIVNLNPIKGSEQARKRPVLIVSGNLLNKYSPVVWVCPLTTKIKNYKGDFVLKPTSENGLSKISEVLTLHLRSISKDRLEKKLGVIPIKELETVRNSVEEILRMD
ncbi:MAG: type II toxin-antitoxin system PemK/MazF family toxin [Bacteroidetes bacterium]|nr:type II toxin-antitoxin system PemK/MazF family toxin [Bacteroidota bacterium]